MQTVISQLLTPQLQQTRMIIKRLRHEVRVYTKKAPWQKRDNGLTARIIVSFAILTILYLVFLSVLAYVGLGAIPIAVIAGIMILAQWYFSDKIVLWSTGAKIVSREQFPELHDLVERIVARVEPEQGRPEIHQDQLRFGPGGKRSP